MVARLTGRPWRPAEPTNMLDINAVLWLETYLRQWPMTLVVVSHARDFLNAVVTDIIHLQGKKCAAATACRPRSPPNARRSAGPALKLASRR